MKQMKTKSVIAINNVSADVVRTVYAESVILHLDIAGRK